VQAHPRDARQAADAAQERDSTSQATATQAALPGSGWRYRAVFDTAPVAIYDVSPDGAFVRANPRFCQLTGYSAGELQSLRIHDVVHPGDLDADLAHTRRLLSGEAGAYSIEKRFLRKDGGVVWAEVTCAAARDPHGTALLLVGVARDLTAQRQAEADVASLAARLEGELARRAAELERANKNLEAFTYSVSHDLRAPLRAISGFAQALVEDDSDRLGDAGREHIERIEVASQRMTTLIDDLLHLSRISRADMHLQRLDLSTEAAAIISKLRSRDPARHVRVSIQEGVVVTGDRSLLRTVMRNLLENAWKFTGRQAGAHIEFGATTAGGQICCYVRDDGAGFDPAYAGKLFLPFQRLHQVTDFPGNGTGLAGVRQIIERHAGHVWAEGSPGRGATFYFTVGTEPAATAHHTP
jgi:PAS domain S-box-containing protein